MSTFGGPSRTSWSKPTPPERGSFPLDHYAECKSFMTDYLKCIKAKKGINADECRVLSEAYLGCRMEKNLMAPDSFQNLGFADIHAREGRRRQAENAAATATATATASTSQPSEYSQPTQSKPLQTQAPASETTKKDSV